MPLSLKAKAELERRRRAAEQLHAFADDDPVRWITTHFCVPELGGPLQLAPYQERCLREALSRNADGTFKYSIILWSDIKKSIKSTIAAAVALWHAFQKSWGQIVIVANDLKQADSRIAYYLRRAVELNPAMRHLVKVRNYKTELPNRTTVEAVPIDPTGEAGGNADAVFYSELWGAHSDAQQRMWTETTLSPTKYGHSFRWVETYAGFNGESPLLEQLYLKGVKEGAKIWDDLPAYRNGSMFCLWNEEPRLPWQTPEYYAQEAAVLPDQEFLRVHRNQWASSESKFVPDAWWEACKAELPALKPQQACVMALDAAISDDSFGVVIVSGEGDTIHVRYAHAWIPLKGKILDYDEIEASIRALLKQFNIIECAYDPFMMHRMAQNLSGAVWMRPFSQNSERLMSDKQLYDLIRDKKIQHDGNSLLKEHIANANAKIIGDKREKLFLVKRSEHLKIDVAVSLSMAIGEALRLHIG